MLQPPPKVYSIVYSFLFLKKVSLTTVFFFAQIKEQHNTRKKQDNNKYLRTCHSLKEHKLESNKNRHK